MANIKKDGFDFTFDPSACEACSGHCCCGAPGYIWVNQNEIQQMCNVLKMNSIDFIHAYLNRINNRFSLKERYSEHGLECVFFDARHSNCSIYEVRPIQCRTFPFWEHVKADRAYLMKECPGVEFDAC